MSYFIKLDAKERKILIQEAKANSSKNYCEFAKILGVSRDMVFKYSRGDYLLPKEMFYKLIGLSKQHPKRYKILKKEKYNRKIFTIPSLNEDLAEIFGVLNGDGHLSRINHEISVIGNVKTDEVYFRYLQKKFKKVFGIAFKVEKFERCLKLRAYSVDLVNWLHEAHNLPKGKKKGSLTIPPAILDSNLLLTSYFRGLFDTDGTFYTRRINEPVIEISSADKNYLMQIKEGLSFLGFNVGLGEHRAFIYNRKEIKKFFTYIEPANPKHLKKFIFYNKDMRG